MRKTKAFTLLELLVVVAIIALLVSVLLPSLSNAREQAKTVLCGTQLKQLYFSFNDYALNNISLPWGFNSISYPRVPSPIERHIDARYDYPGWWWFDYLSNDTKTASELLPLLCCPSRNIADSEYTKNLVWGNYGVNQSLCTCFNTSIERSEFGNRPPLRWPVQNPAATMLLMDSGYAMINWWYATISPPEELHNEIYWPEDKSYVPGLRSVNEAKLDLLYSSQLDDAINGRHNHRRVNVCFADGHVECLAAEDLEVIRQGDEYKNRMPFWTPGH